MYLLNEHFEVLRNVVNARMSGFRFNTSYVWFTFIISILHPLIIRLILKESEYNLLSGGIIENYEGNLIGDK